MSGRVNGPGDVTGLPEGARDVLPVERAELAAIEQSIRGVFARFGYREVRTPLLEFAETIDRAQDGGAGRAFRLFDDHGRVLVLRPDLTIPVARLVANRYGGHGGPVRVSYVGPRLRPARAGRAQPIEERQAGAELVGLPGPAADAEVVAVLIGSLRELGVDDLRVAVGDVGLMRAALQGLGVGAEDATRLQAAVLGRDLVAWRRIAEGLDLPGPARELLADLPARRGGADELGRLAADIPGCADACAALSETLERLAGYGVADAVMVDLGVLRDWGYYSGLVFEAYAPGVGRPVGVGGRYDRLGARFGVGRPAVGLGLMLDAVHQAVSARTAAQGLGDGVVLAGGLDAHVGLATRLRAAGMIVVGLPGGGDPAALAEEDGWRWAAEPGPDGWRVLDRSTGERITVDDILEVLRSRSS